MRQKGITWRVLLPSDSGFLLVPLQERKWLLCAGGGSLWWSQHNCKSKGWRVPLQMPPMLVGISRGLLGLLQRPGEAFAGVFSKWCHLQEEMFPLEVYRKTVNKGSEFFICRDQKSWWMGGVCMVLLSHVARRLHC